MAHSPIQHRAVYAMPETIEEEYQAALRVQQMKADSTFVREASGGGGHFGVVLAWLGRPAD